MATNNAINIGVVAGSGQTYTFPAATDTLVARASTDTLTNKTYDTAGTGNSFSINGVAATANTGTGAVARATSPVFVTPTLGAATATSINGNTFTTGTYTLTGTATKTLNFTNTLTLSGTDSTTMTFPTTSATIARTDAANTFTGVQTMTSPALTTPAITGLATGTGVATAATVSTLALRDANGNLTAVNHIEGFTTTATAAGTTTITITSTYTQVFTGSSTQTVKLPTTSVAAGGQYLIINQSTGAVTVQSSGANTIVILAANTSAIFTAVVATPTTAANWSSQYIGLIATSGKSLSVSNTITLAGTDGTTMTFPTTSATIARTDAANTFTGVQTLSSSPVLSSGAVTVSGNAVTFPTTADTLVARATTDTLTNKRVNKRIGTEASSATSTPTADSVDQWNVTALAAADAFAAPTGTPVDGQDLVIRIKDNGTARALTWNAIYRASSDLALPSTTIISKTLYLGFRYNAADSKWDLLSLLNNF